MKGRQRVLTSMPSRPATWSPRIRKRSVRTPQGRGRFWSGSQRGAGESLRIWLGLPFFSVLEPVTTLTVTYWQSTADGWDDEHCKYRQSGHDKTGSSGTHPERGRHPSCACEVGAARHGGN